MNQFAPSDTVSAKASDNLSGNFSDNSGSNTAVLEAYEPANKLLPVKNDEKNQQTDALVQSGVLSAMTIDGLIGQVTLTGEDDDAPNPGGSDKVQPSSDPNKIDINDFSEKTRESGRELAALINSGASEEQMMALVKQGLISGELEDVTQMANLELQKSDRPSSICLGLMNEKMTYEVEDAGTIQKALIEIYNQRASVSIFDYSGSRPRLSFDVKYDPDLEGFKAPYPSNK